MMKFNEKERRAADSLKSHPSFPTIYAALETELAISTTGLYAAKDEQIGKLQGRCLLLKELLNLLKPS